MSRFTDPSDLPKYKIMWLGPNKEHSNNCAVIAGCEGEDEYCDCQYYLCLACNLVFISFCGDISNRCTCWGVNWGTKKYCNRCGINTSGSMPQSKGCRITRIDVLCAAFVEKSEEWGKQNTEKCLK